MIAVEFEGSRPIHKPADMTDEQCSSLQILTGLSHDPGNIPDQIQFFKHDENGVPFFLSCWKPSREDIQAINEGRPIWLKICGFGHPPVALFTTDAEGNGNF